MNGPVPAVDPGAKCVKYLVVMTTVSCVHALNSTESVWPDRKCVR